MILLSQTLFVWNSYSLPSRLPNAWEQQRNRSASEDDIADRDDDVSYAKDHNHCVLPEPSAVDKLLERFRAENEEMQRQNGEMQKMIDQITAKLEAMAMQCRWDLQRFAGSDEDI